MTEAESVLAISVGRQQSFRRVRRRERLRSTFWFIPTCFVVAAGVAASLVHRLDEDLAIGREDAPWWVSSASSAATVLSTIAAAMLTFVGVVFSISLVALQLASSQLSPRVLRNFVRSPVPKLAFGTFMATFFYALFLLAQVSDDQDAPVPVVGATGALLLVAASVAMFVVYVDSTVKQMQVSEMISRVAADTRMAIGENYRAVEHFVSVARPQFETAPQTVTLGSREASDRASRRRGVLLGVDVSGLVDWAMRHDAVVVMVADVGDYTPGGTALFEVHSDGDAPVRELSEMVDLGHERTLYQDPLYGIRQLVDTAAQALSPAINAPTTAVQVIDRLVDIMVRIGCAPDPSPYIVDSGGVVRLVRPVNSWDDVVALAFVEIRQFGVGSSQVTRRLMASFDAIERDVPTDRAPAIRVQRDALVHAVRGQPIRTDEQDFALTPDRRGIA